jgi:hypothetical protein
MSKQNAPDKLTAYLCFPLAHRNVKSKDLNLPQLKLPVNSGVKILMAMKMTAAAISTAIKGKLGMFLFLSMLKFLKTVGWDCKKKPNVKKPCC